MILVTGATGNIGGALIAELVARGAPVRALARDPAKAAGLAERGVEVVAGDLGDPASLDAAMAGAERLFLLSAATPDQATLQGNAVAAAQRAGVRQIVKLSALGAADGSPVSFFRWHAETERQIADAGVPATLLRPNSFIQNLLSNAGTITGQGAIYGARGEARVSLVDVRDIAAVSAAALTEDGHAGKTYEITGPEALTNDEVAAILTEAVGKPVAYINVPLDAYGAALRGAGLPDFLATGLTELEAALADGIGAPVTDAVPAVTGQQGRTVGQFVRENAAAFR